MAQSIANRREVPLHQLATAQLIYNFRSHFSQRAKSIDVLNANTLELLDNSDAPVADRKIADNIILDNLAD